MYRDVTHTGRMLLGESAVVMSLGITDAREDHGWGLRLTSTMVWWIAVSAYAL